MGLLECVHLCSCLGSQALGSGFWQFLWCGLLALPAVLRSWLCLVLLIAAAFCYALLLACSLEHIWLLWSLFTSVICSILICSAATHSFRPAVNQNMSGMRVKTYA